MSINLSGFIIGIWLYLYVGNFNQDKWTWLLIGLLFGQYALILFGIIVIISNAVSHINLFSALKPILLILIISIMISPLTSFVFPPYMAKGLGSSDYGLFFEYKSYIVFVEYVIMLLMNIVFAFKLNSWIKELKIENKAVWVVSTVFLGLFPVILFHEYILIESKNKDEA